MHSILLVEHDPLIAKLLTVLLVGRGYEVEVASNAAAALCLLDQRRFDAVVCAFDLVDQSGRTLCQLVRVHPLHSQVPVIVIRAGSRTNLALRNATAVLPKLFPLTPLVDLLAAHGVPPNLAPRFAPTY